MTTPSLDHSLNRRERLNLTLVEGYPSRSSEAGGLLKDQFVKPARSQAKWYDFVSDQQKSDTGTEKTVTSWNTDASKVNSTYSRIAKAAGISSTPPASRQISQDNLRRWEKLAREASTISNQAAGFNRCLYRVQDNMKSQLKSIKTEMAKGKSSSRASGAADELQFLMNFNASIIQVMAKTLEHLSDFVFVTVANTTLARRDSYLLHLKAGIKPDTLASLRTAPLHIPTLFPDEALWQAEQDIATFESKGQPHSGKKGHFHPYGRPEKRGDNRKQERPAWKKVTSTPMDALKSVGITGNRNDQHGKTLDSVDRARSLKARPPTTPQDRPRASSLTNDSYCVNSLTRRLLARSTVQRQTDTFVNLNVVPCVHTAPGHSQKKEISPGAAVCLSQKNYNIKSVKLASCVTPLSCVKSVVNARNAVTNPPVGARLQNFWQTWLNLGASHKIVQILREGCTLRFQNRPLLSRHPTVISRYANHHRNSYLSEALHQLISKNAVELVQNPKSLGFFNRLFLVPKPNNKWRPILDLSKLNLFLKVEKFKMETPETIRTSLQQGEWVTSVNINQSISCPRA